MGAISEKMASSFGKSKKTRNKSDATNRHKRSVADIVELVIENSDIILEVMDARFVEKTRQQEIEKKIEYLGKKIIRVLNKSDLADLKKIYEEIELGDLKPCVLFSAKQRRGTVTLRKLIKKEAKKLGKDDVTVGIIGYPNTGKSSVTNILSGKSAARVSSESGYTKSFQKIRLAKEIYLIDTPGIILDDKNPTYSPNAVKHSKIGAVSWNKAKDPEIAAESIFMEYSEALEEHYGISSGKDPEEFIEKLGRKMNFLKKGGLVDDKKTARKVLRDWQEGRIKT